MLIFIKDRDNLWYRFKSIVDALGWLEPIDVENQEFQCWDSNGNSIDICLDETGSIIFIPRNSNSDISLKDEMIRSIPGSERHLITLDTNFESLWKIIKKSQ